MIITPSQIASQYLEVPTAWDHTSDYDWTTHAVPGYFKVWIPKGRLTEISLLVFGAGSEYGTICLSYGKLPGPWDDDGPFARHGSVPLDELDSTAFQFAGTGQVVRQPFPTPFPGGNTWLYGAIAGGNPFALQVVMRLSDEVVPPEPEVTQKCTLKTGTTKLVINTGGRLPKSTEIKKNKFVMEF